MSIANWDPSKLILVVDLDDTLIQTNSLYENFWAAWSSNWATPIAAALALSGGPLALKHRLARLCCLDVSHLPYNSEVLKTIRSWRVRGGKVALVTGSVQVTADAVSDHLGLFDYVHGSELINLKGRNKASFLEKEFGSTGYCYIGDCYADLAVWEKASHAVTLNPNLGFRARVNALGKETHHLDAATPRPSDYLRALRPHQWLKNLLVFVPMFAAHELTWPNLAQSLLVFLAFSLVASSTYILNDLLDLSADRVHPRKRNRPFASGRVPIAHGTWLVPLLGGLGSAAAFWAGWQVVVVLAAYSTLTVLYSLRLKRFAVIDICSLAILYTLRVLAGSAATGIPSSVWLLAFSMFFFFGLAAVKRQAELVQGAAAGQQDTPGRGYRAKDLPIVDNMASSSSLVAVLVLALYANSAPVQTLYRTPEVLWGICLVLLFWNNRMILLTHRGQMHDDPLVFAARDRVSLVCCAIVGALGLGGALL